MWIIILAIIIFFVVRHYKKKKAAAAASTRESEPATPTQVETHHTAPSAPSAVSRPAKPQAAAPKTSATLDRPTDTAPKATLDKPQSNAPVAAHAPVAAPASAIDGLNYMDVRKYTDPAKRIPLMMAFADAGDELAQYEVGQLYVMGLDGVKKDYEKGKELLYKAGRGGATNAWALLGQVSIRQALDSVSICEKQGLSHEDSMKVFSTFYDEGAEALATGIASGNEFSMDTVSGAFELGWNQGQLGETLVFATTRALAPKLDELKAKDDGWSNYVLGTIAMRGICMPQDLALARSYYLRGAELGDHNSKTALENPLLSMDEDEDEE